MTDQHLTVEKRPCTGFSVYSRIIAGYKIAVIQKHYEVNSLEFVVHRFSVWCWDYPTSQILISILQSNWFAETSSLKPLKIFPSVRVCVAILATVGGGLSFLNVVNVLFPRWTCKICHMDMQNIPPSMSDYTKRHSQNMRMAKTSSLTTFCWYVWMSDWQDGFYL